MDVEISYQRPYLVVRIPTAAEDRLLTALIPTLLTEARHRHIRGVIVDLAGCDVVDSFAAAALRELARQTEVDATPTVVVGIQPGVAFAMVQIGLHREGPMTALDVEDGRRQLDAWHATRTPLPQT